LLTNSPEKKKRGPKDVPAENVYVFAHQAYWGFRFLAKWRKTFWKQILDAKTVRSIQEVGRACSQAHAMANAGYGAAGLMTWLTKREVALQVLNAKDHRRYPNSERASSEDRRMIFLGIAVAAGVWGIKYSTALRKLPQAGLGAEYMAREVHDFDKIVEYMKKNSIVSAESIGNYFYRLSDGRLVQTDKFPCNVPANCFEGYIIHGYDPEGRPLSTYSPTLPPELIP
jgi:hypothetical protein